MTSKTATATTQDGSPLYYPIMVALGMIAFCGPLYLGYQVTAATEGLYGFLSGLALAATIRHYLTSDKFHFDYVLMTGLCVCFGAALLMTYPQDQHTTAWMALTSVTGFAIDSVLRFLRINAPQAQTL